MLLWQAEDTTPHECDGLTAYRQRPLVVCLPETEEQVQAVLIACHRLGRCWWWRRGAGTGLSGGAMPHAHGRDAVAGQVQPHPRCRSGGAHGARAMRRAQPGHQRGRCPHGLYYAPDPSSQIACTIGGNVAENSGGVHCLKYGLTVHNVLQGARLHHGGRAIEFGGQALTRPAYDLLAPLIGSEGMLAVALR